jgi:hypothetical protein
MKWTLQVLVTVFVLTLGSLAVQWGNAQQPPRPIAVASFDFLSPLPEPPEAMPVYRVLPPEVSRDQMKRWMEAFDLEGEIVGRERQLVVTQGERVLEAFTQSGTGYVRFSDNRSLAVEEVADNLPAEGEAVERAEEFLKQYGLLPENASFAGIGYYEFRRADPKGSVVEEGRSGISVGFAFELDELPVVGPGAKASVAFGADGKIIGAARIWRDSEVGAQVEIISPERALELFKAGWPPEKADSEPAITTVVTISEVEMAYYAGPGPLPQEWIEPVYVFRGFYEMDGTIGERRLHEKDHFQIVIPAVPDGETRPHSNWGPRRIE